MAKQPKGPGGPIPTVDPERARVARLDASGQAASPFDAYGLALSEDGGGDLSDVESAVEDAVEEAEDAVEEVKDALGFDHQSDLKPGGPLPPDIPERIPLEDMGGQDAGSLAAVGPVRPDTLPRVDLGGGPAHGSVNTGDATTDGTAEGQTSGWIVHPRWREEPEYVVYDGDGDGQGSLVASGGGGSGDQPPHDASEIVFEDRRPDLERVDLGGSAEPELDLHTDDSALEELDG